MIGILDYGMGNLGSVRNTCAALGVEARILETPGDMTSVQGLLMPGQGAFRDCMAHLRDQGWVEPVRDWIRADRPFFGICMGLQVLFEDSEESPGVKGLGILPGTVRRFPDRPGLKVPQMGWNRASWTKPGPVFTEDLNGRHFYFVHSYHVPLAEADWVAGTTTFGREYVSAVSFGHCHAVQFHPEKSQKDGLALVKAFADSVP
jgi:imidazole glycerol phosphate synthase glutamine amidotransferase subunit